ncbi:nuclear transport factor 2 family protein [Nonomuraea sp. NPDC050328]|uniref:nuclear transport factor 2 family protein n=1 Tax=Nonomuraea sp. NPDC050328 TaxID=3364361 RepID=UPI0037AA3EE8
MNELFERQLKAIRERDLGALLAQYHPEAVVVRLDLVAAGPDEIRDLFAAYLAREPEVVELTALRTTGDTVFYSAVMALDGLPYTTFGTLVARDGLIWRQTAGAVPAQ